MIGVCMRPRLIRDLTSVKSTNAEHTRPWISTTPNTEILPSTRAPSPCSRYPFQSIRWNDKLILLAYWFGFVQKQKHRLMRERAGTLVYPPYTVERTGSLYEKVSPSEPVNKEYPINPFRVSPKFTYNGRKPEPNVGAKLYPWVVWHLSKLEFFAYNK